MVEAGKLSDRERRTVDIAEVYPASRLSERREHAQASRVLLLGLDSADAELIERWADEGHLPTFAAAAPRGPVAPARHHRRGHARLGVALDLHRHHAGPARPLPRLSGARRRPARPAHPARVVRPAAVLEVPRRRRPALHRVGRVHGLPGCAGFKGVQILEYGTWTWFSRARSSRPRPATARSSGAFGPYPAPEHSRQVTRCRSSSCVSRPAGRRRARGQVARRRAGCCASSPGTWRSSPSASRTAPGTTSGIPRIRDYPLHPQGGARRRAASAARRLRRGRPGDRRDRRDPR